MTKDKIEARELAAMIHETVKRLDANGLGVVSLDHFAFDRIPCSRRKVYAVAKKHAAEWGYDYCNAYYQASGNRAFAKVTAEKQAYRSGPSLYARRHA